MGNFLKIIFVAIADKSEIACVDGDYRVSILFAAPVAVAPALEIVFVQAVPWL